MPSPPTPGPPKPEPGSSRDTSSYERKDRYTFLCDAKPVEVYVVNRKLKQTYTASVTSVFAFPTNVINLRGLPTGITPPVSTTPAPVSKGGSPAIAPLDLQTVVSNLLNDTTFDIPLRSVQEEGEQLKSNARSALAAIQEFHDKLQRLDGAGAVLGPSQGSATLLGTNSLLAAAAANIPVQLSSPALPNIEAKFDQQLIIVNNLVQDVARLNTAVQAFPISDQLISLQTLAESVETASRQYNIDIETIRTAIRILNEMLTNPRLRSYIAQRNEAQIRLELQSKLPNAPNLDAATIGAIMKRYSDATTTGTTPFIQTLPARLAGLTRQLDTLGTPVNPDLNLVTPGTVRAQYNASAALVSQVRADIQNVNASEANLFDTINNIYQTFRIPYPSVIPLDLQGNTGNLTVFYGIYSTENFQPYLMKTNEVPQPSPSTLVSPTPAASPAPATASAAAASAPAPATLNGASTTAPPQLAEYYGSFQVHRFDHGTIVGGFAFTNIRRRFYSIVAQPTSTTTTAGTTSATGTTSTTSTVTGSTTTVTTGSTTGTTSTTSTTIANGIITEHDSTPNIDVVAGVIIYFKPRDMYPGASYDLPSHFGALFEASVYPLNQYLPGIAFEPRSGINLGAGLAIGQENRLPTGGPYYVGAPANTSASLPTASKFRYGFFVSVGFDFNIFQAIFANVKNVGAPAAAAASTSTTASQ